MPSKRQAKTTSASKGKTLVPSESPSHAAKKLLLDVDNLTVVLSGQRVVDDVSFCVHSSEFIGVIGPNGAGKTTLLRAILGLIGTSKGTLDKRAHKIGYVPQRGFMQGGQVPLSVMEVVGLGASGKTDAARKALKDVNMEDYAGRRLSELSGGQQQRVLIAKALAAKPELLILDEPTTGIDAKSQTEFYKILTGLQQKGITVMMVSHDVDAVVSQVSRIICMNHIILYDGPAEHFEIDRYLPKFYATRHKVLHHHHEGEHA